MGVDIHGWVEVDPLAEEEPQEQIWLGVVNAGAIIQRNTATFGEIFGVRYDDFSSAFAPHRGFPVNFSAHIEGAHKWGHSQSWLLFSEFQTLRNAKKANGETLENFDLIFNLMQLLANEYGEKNVRLVVWFIG